MDGQERWQGRQPITTPTQSVTNQESGECHIFNDAATSNHTIWHVLKRLTQGNLDLMHASCMYATLGHKRQSAPIPDSRKQGSSSPQLRVCTTYSW
jgi:hypothetical protein